MTAPVYPYPPGCGHMRPYEGLELETYERNMLQILRAEIIGKMQVLMSNELGRWSSLETAQTIRHYAQALAFLTPGLVPEVALPVQSELPPKEK